MDRRRVCALLLPLLLVPTPDVSADSPVQACFGLPQTERRLECIEQRLEPLGQLLDELEVSDPAHASDVLQVLDLASEHHVAALRDNDELRARMMDVRGQALTRLGRRDEAADALAGAVNLNDGVSRLRWVSRGPAPSWERALDIGSGRVERAAVSLVEAGRLDQARPMVERILELGGDGPVSERLPESASMPTGRRSPLLVERWRRTLPDVDLPLVDGSVLRQDDIRGKVVVLDFWATWCAPCLDQLPNLQQLHESEAERGLLAVAINVDEPRYVFAPFVDELGLTMPVGTYEPALHEPYGVNRLPTLIVADRAGRVHARWDGHERGQEREVSRLVQSLLNDVEEPPIEAAQVVYGAGFLEVEWLRELASTVGGVALIAEESETKILVSQGRVLAIFRHDGAHGRQWKSTTSAGRLRVGPATEMGDYAVLGFRPGAARLMVFDMPGGKFRTHEMPSPILDAAFLDAGETTRMVIATIDGLFVLHGPEGEIDELGEFREVSDIEQVGPANGARLALLSRTDRSRRRVSWLSAGLELVESMDAPGDAWALFWGPGNPPGIGIAPSQVVSATVGSFLGGDAAQTAVATRGGQLVIVDLATGTLLYRARWDSISDLAAGDLDRDGRDELVVAAGNRVAVLSAPQ